MKATKSRSASATFCVQSAFVLVFFLLAWTVAAQNLVTNPGFETGDTSGWFAFGSPTISAETSQVHSGTYAALVNNRTATYMGIAQSLLGVLQTNETYNISAWVRLVSGTNQTMQLTIQQIDGNGTVYTNITSGSVSSTNWSQLSGQFTFNISGALTSLTLYAEMPSSSNAAYYIDDVSIPSLDTNVINGQCTVDSGTVFQRIDGFGASSAWESMWTTNQADMFFATNSGTGRGSDGTSFSYTGIGLSLLRTRIAPGGSTIENSIMQMAQALGAKVWSTPWSPAANFKSNGSTTNGGFVGNTNNYQAYANQLAGYVVSMKKTYGINLYALSIQNEPDANVNSYESCNWSPQEIHDFVPYLYNALVASNVASTKIILPESQNWQDYSNLTVTAMTDPNTASLVSIVADHNYDGMTGPSSLIKNTYGKTLWETEVALLSGSDSSIANGVYYAGRIHLFMTSAQVNAWHYWWLLGGNSTGNESLTDGNNVPTKRMYALGNFSRFVRPNYYRINVANTTSQLQISAYQDSVSSNFAVVAVNASPNQVMQTFNLTNFSAASVTPWVTSASLSLAGQPPVAVTNQSFSYLIPGMSIVTFAGQASATNSGPVLAAVSNRTVNAGATVTITNVATDPQSPPLALTYSLLANPAFAALNSTNGVLTWRPHVSQAGTSNLFTVMVADSGIPSQTATNSFTIFVNPLAQTHLKTAIAGGQLNLQASGPQGPDYTLQTSTNLTDWLTLLTTNSLTMPIPFAITNVSGIPDQFYRIELGP